MKRALVTVAALGLALTTAACTSTADEPEASSSVTTTKTKASPTSEASTTSSEPETTEADEVKDIVDTAVAAGSFETLATALTKAELVDTLKGDGPFTVFAPTDDAFAELPAGTLDGLLADKEKLAGILTYHVVSGKVMAADVATMDGKSVETVAGEMLTVKVADGKVMLMDGAGNTINVVKTDIAASNGVIHVIDGVLMPAA